jgi:tetratricopeptide (TPR) repeat protein
MAESHREEIAKLESLYASNPEGRVFTHLAEAYRKAGELERARDIVEQGLARHADYASAHVVLGRVLTDLGREDDARAAFQRVLELDQHNLVALRSLGDLADRANDHEEALRRYRELLALDPGDDRLRETITALEGRGAETAAGMVEELPDVGMAPVLTGEHAEEDPAAARNWEEEIGPEQEVMPGDLAVLAGTGEAAQQDAAPDEAFIAIEPAAAGAQQDAAPADEAVVAFEPAAAPADYAEAPEAADFAPFGTGEGVIMPQPLAGVYGDRVAEPEPVYTETIAELYAAQGLHGRAAEVYRMLLVERPEDERLRERLRQSEAAAHEPSWAPAERAVPSAEPEREDAAWLEGVESAWTGGSGVAGAGPTPYAWTDSAQADEGTAGVRIAEYFRGLLEWRPRGSASSRLREGGTGDGPPPNGTADGSHSVAVPAAESTAGEFTARGGDAPVAQGAATDRTADGGTEGASEEDEDLEMFRSWLQSLKK